MTNEPQSDHALPKEQLEKLLAMLERQSQRNRLIAIQALGEIGNLAMLWILRERQAARYYYIQEHGIHLVQDATIF